MAKLKIISNPYKKEIRYQKWQDIMSKYLIKCYGSQII